MGGRGGMKTSAPQFYLKENKERSAFLEPFCHKEQTVFGGLDRARAVLASWRGRVRRAHRTCAVRACEMSEGSRPRSQRQESKSHVKFVCAVNA